MALSHRRNLKRRKWANVERNLNSFVDVKVWAEITCWCSMRQRGCDRTGAGTEGPSAAERRPVYGGEPATPCLPWTAALSFRTHSCPPAPLPRVPQPHEPPARTNWQRRMQTCFVNGCDCGRGSPLSLSRFLFQNNMNENEIATVALHAIGSHLRHFFTPRMRRD